MLYLEELVEAVMIEEGQFLMGLPFVTETLGLDMNKMSILFKKSMLEYSKRKPYKATEIFNTMPVIMPEGTIAVRAVRYGVLPELPRYYMDSFGETGYEYDKLTRKLIVWPPIYPVKVTYDRGYTLTNDFEIPLSFNQNEDEDYIFEFLPCTPKRGTVVITKGNLTMNDVDFQIVTEDEGGVENTKHILHLSGTLGSGTIDVDSREMQLDLLDTDEGKIEMTYKPKYKCIAELDVGNYAFTKLFASKMLEALASLRSQATQQALHQIDLTTDDLYSRVRILKREVKELLRSTISFSGMFNI